MKAFAFEGIRLTFREMKRRNFLFVQAVMSLKYTTHVQKLAPLKLLYICKRHQAGLRNLFLIAAALDACASHQGQWTEQDLYERRGQRWIHRSNTGQNILIYGTAQIKNEATFFIVLIIMLFTVLVHSYKAR